MTEMPVTRCRTPFVRELRRTLLHLYDPARLRTSPLGPLLAGNRPGSASTLRDRLMEAIEALKPSGSVSPQSDAWRTYRTLSYRYVGQFPQTEVAKTLGLSIRHMKRQESMALVTLADYLWTHFDLEHSALAQAPIQGTAAGQPLLTDVDAPTRQQELLWAQESLHTEVVNAAELIRTLRQLVEPLAHALSVRMEYEVSDDLPRLDVKPVPTRQALLSLLTAAIHTVPGGSVRIEEEARPRQVCTTISSVSAGSTCQLPKEQLENLEMACQLAAISGGSLEVLPGGAGTPFKAQLVLPAAEQAAVLAIDDNADTLQLFQRYLNGSRYPFVGVRNPQEALALTEKVAPRIIVLDVMLPGIDGWEVLGRLREHPSTRQVPVIVCTIMAQEQLALSLGAAAFLRKPVSRKALLAALDHQLGQPSPGSA